MSNKTGSPAIDQTAKSHDGASAPDARLGSALDFFSSLANSSSNQQLLVGRYASMDSSEGDIFNDLLAKLAVGPGQSVLSVGVGCGQLATCWLRKALEMNLSLYFVDFPDVIKRIKTELLPAFPALPSLQVSGGIFPFDTVDDLKDLKFDCIDIYGVIQYTETPLKIIEAAVSLLAPGGRLLIGDIPNLDKKGRFLSTPKGREFEAAYRKVPLGQIPVYENYREFTKQALIGGAPRLDDDFVLDLVARYRRQGYGAYVLNQPLDLPFGRTREDFLIVAPNG